MASQNKISKELILSELSELQGMIEEAEGYRPCLAVERIRRNRWRIIELECDDALDLHIYKRLIGKGPSFYDAMIDAADRWSVG